MGDEIALLPSTGDKSVNTYMLSQKMNTLSYQVQKDDTIENISLRYNITPSELCKLNKITSRVIFPLQIIRVPLPKENKETSLLLSHELSRSFTQHDQESSNNLTVDTKSRAFSFDSSRITTKADKTFEILKFQSNVLPPPKVEDDFIKNIIHNSMNVNASPLHEHHLPLDRKTLKEEQNPLVQNFLKTRALLLFIYHDDNYHNYNFAREHLKIMIGTLLMTPNTIMFDEDRATIQSQSLLLQMSSQQKSQILNFSIPFDQIQYILVFSDLQFVLDNSDSITSQIDEIKRLSGFLQSSSNILNVYPFKIIPNIKPTDKNLLPEVENYVTISAKDYLNRDNRKLIDALKISFDHSFEIIENIHEDEYQYDEKSEMIFILIKYDFDQSCTSNKNEMVFVILNTEWEKTCSFLEQFKFVSEDGTERYQSRVMAYEQKKVEPLHDLSPPQIDPDMPSLLNGESEILLTSQLIQLNKVLPARAIGYYWILAYSTSKHGFSLQSMYRRLQTNYVDADSPILVIIKDKDNNVFGSLASCPLKLSEHFYGTGETFLFTFHPKFKIYRWTGENSYFIQGTPDSLAFGAGKGHYGLWLDADFYHGRSHPCQTFGNETPLGSTEDFIVNTIEMWWFGDAPKL